MKKALISFLLFMAVPSLSQAVDVELSKKEPGIIMELSTETWAKAEKARLVTSVSAATRDEDIVSIRVEILKALASLSHTEWHVTGYNRSQDSAGLTRLNITAETRADEKTLSDIYSQTKKLSRAGMQISIVDIDYSPSLLEREKALAEARRQLYRMAVEEAERAEGILKGGYKVWRVDFIREQQPSYRPQVRTMALAEAAVAPEMPRGDLIRVNATVILRAAGSQ